MKPIFLDYDSVLNDIAPAWIRWVYARYGKRVTTKDMIHFNWLEENFPGANEFWSAPGCYSYHIAPLPGAVNFVRACEMEFGAENVFILTSSPENMAKEKDEHIENYFDIPEDRIIHDHLHDKSVYTKHGILVDDYPKNCINHIDAHGTPAILFNLNGEYGWSEPARYPHLYAPEYHDRLLLRATSYDSAFRHIKTLQG